MPHIEIDIGAQRLRLLDNSSVLFECPVSTASNGPGEKMNSECTPRGLHSIRAKIGAGCPENTVFVGRRPSGEIYSTELKEASPERDWILTRILWLRGLEQGKNLMGDVDTMRRYIYIHGTPEDEPIGAPASHGCIRMQNADIVKLFDLVNVGTHVNIVE